FSKKNPIFAYKTSYFQFGTLKYIDVYKKLWGFGKIEALNFKTGWLRHACRTVTPAPAGGGG
ncbi:hypothetical protein, partial [Alistipes senegalensis]|uniref:hypothetical protein n=1 Tax=Alistipes senegalensis TaxID=1288121 RepID=UPI001E5B3A76